MKVDFQPCRASLIRSRYGRQASQLAHASTQSALFFCGAFQGCCKRSTSPLVSLHFRNLDLWFIRRLRCCFEQRRAKAAAYSGYAITRFLLKEALAGRPVKALRLSFSRSAKSAVPRED